MNLKPREPLLKLSLPLTAPAYPVLTAIYVVHVDMESHGIRQTAIKQLASSLANACRRIDLGFFVYVAILSGTSLPQQFAMGYYGGKQYLL